MSAFNLERADLHALDLDVHRRLEWLVANGRGGFAMAAANQMLTRRYHGLLVAAAHPPAERFVLLAKLDATVRAGGLTYDLATNDYPEAVHPTGYRLLESFSPAPTPRWVWRTGAARIEQRLCLVHGENAVVVQYRVLESAGPVQISVRPLCTCRSVHHLMHVGDASPPAVDAACDRVALAWPGDRPNWNISHNGAFTLRPDWYFQFVLAAEAARGYDHTQDLFMPGVIGATLSPGDDVGLVIAASTEERSWKTWPAAFDAAQSRAAKLDSLPQTTDPLVAALARAADDFLVTRKSGGQTILAGYPWFLDWGRDTFIALPGLCLVTGRLDVARSILDEFSRHVSEGIVPNVFPDGDGEPAYNTADATLWYVHAMDRYLDYGGDAEFVDRRMWPVLCDILEAHERGTRFHIRCAPDGLLAQGEPGAALTWMDARVNGLGITPRIGKAVEICALWYNALCIGARWAARRGDERRAGHWTARAARAKESFNKSFWNPDKSCLFDVIDADHVPGNADDRIRPNQLLAISLTHPILDQKHWSAVVKVCECELLTPLGLRTLAPGEPGFCEKYQGNQEQLDSAYHQGTVWPWLLGPFVTAYIKATGNSAEARRRARCFFDGLTAHLLDAGIGGVSEVADATAPHAPGGCPFQAWSVAEPLRALWEDVLDHAPTAKGPAPSLASRAQAKLARASK